MYASESNLRGAIYSEMEHIRNRALLHNGPAGISTALLYQSGWFVQWTEGPVHAIRELLEHIAQDARHRNLCIVHSSSGPRLLSGPWSMAIVLADDSYEEMTQRVQRVRERMEFGLQYSPTAIWRQLSTPLRHPGARQQAEPDAFQRISVCDAAEQYSFDLVRWLAHRNGEPVVHRRFAGDAGLDVGTDYVDFADGDRVLRVIAMARKGLLLSLTRAFLADDSHIVLLLSGDPQHDLALVHRVAEACTGMNSPPALIGVAEKPEAHAEPFAYAHVCGLIYLDAIADPQNPIAVWMACYPYLSAWREAANSSVISRPDYASTMP